jgi:hypothetical protein
MSSRVLRVVPLAIVLSLANQSIALAHYGDWASNTERWNVFTGYMTRTSQDTVGARTWLTWEPARIVDLQHAASSHGARFTVQADDLSANLNATGTGSSTLPSPYYDRDNDTSDSRFEEAEITAQATPYSGVEYVTTLYFMHWYAACSGTSCTWRWDPDGGTIQHSEQMSAQVCCGDKWNSVACCTVLGSNTYPYKAQTSAAQTSSELSASDYSPGQSAVGASGAAREPAAAASLAKGISLVWTGDAGEIRVDPDLSGGLDRYAADARALSAQLAKTGASEGVVTFARPIQLSDIDRLQTLGLQVTQVEAVSPEFGPDLRWTVFAPSGPELATTLDYLFKDADADMLGTISANVVVPNSKVLTSITSDPDVYLVDLSLEQAMRAQPNHKDFVMNDVYWELAGWLD